MNLSRSRSRSLCPSSGAGREGQSEVIEHAANTILDDFLRIKAAPQEVEELGRNGCLALCQDSDVSE